MSDPTYWTGDRLVDWAARVLLGLAPADRSAKLRELREANSGLHEEVVARLRAVRAACRPGTENGDG